MMSVVVAFQDVGWQLLFLGGLSHDEPRLPGSTSSTAMISAVKLLRKSAGRRAFAVPGVAAKNYWTFQKHNRWQCKSCGYQFSVMSGTIMHDSHLPLRKWFLAIYLMCESKKGISANQMKRTLGVAYKTAWYLCHRIREAMGNDPLEGPTLVGIVEVDETFVGGKAKGKGRGYKGEQSYHCRGQSNGTDTSGWRRIPDVRRKTLHAFISRAVKDEAEAIYTDEFKSYLGIAGPQYSA